MPHTDTTPEEQSAPSPDGMDRLEHMHRQMIESQEAWRKLLENLERVRKKNNPGRGSRPTTDKPSE
jgi:hypothetical protein